MKQLHSSLKFGSWEKKGKKKSRQQYNNTGDIKHFDFDIYKKKKKSDTIWDGRRGYWHKNN